MKCPTCRKNNFFHYQSECSPCREKAYGKIKMIVRLSYKISRISKKTFGLFVCSQRRRIDSMIGGGEFRMHAAFDSIKELGKFVSDNPLPLPKVITGLIKSQAYADQWELYFREKLGGRVFWGREFKK